MRKLIYLIATSVDGFIARTDGSFEDFPNHPDTLATFFGEYPEACPAHARDALGITGEPKHFDTVIMGARTHEPAIEAGLTSAYPHLDHYVVTHRTDWPADAAVTFVRDDPQALVRDLKQRPGKDIWLAGGGNLAGQLVEEIDEYHLKVNPVLLGEGIPLLAGNGVGVRLRPVASRPFGAGVTLATYVPAGR
ncbi:dihydrofolate reductase family protein [Georgenia halophila]|uniref:Dihydrofolate reductase family protein n=1 Tax=Georgenia halophila TaxID=620889 RepID=A0ABP8LCA1_9MICO